MTLVQRCVEQRVFGRLIVTAKADSHHVWVQCRCLMSDPYAARIRRGQRKGVDYRAAYEQAMPMIGTASLREIAAAVGVGETTIRTWRDGRQIPPAKIGGAHA